MARPIPGCADGSGLDEGVFRGEGPAGNRLGGCLFVELGKRCGRGGGGAFRSRTLRKKEGRAQNGSHFPPPQNTAQPSLCSGERSQVLATLQWNGFLESRCAADRSVLRINMDETSVKLWLGGQRGCVVQAGEAASLTPFEQGVTLRARRSAVSLACFVCDDPEVQRLLPQVIVANDRVIPATVAAEFQVSQTGNVFLLRRKSAWVNASTLLRIIALLAAAVAPLLSSRHIIFSMDACPVHLVPEVMRAVAKGGMHFLLLGAQTTKWLQPCDVAVFGSLKHRLRQLYGERQVRSRQAELTPLVFLDMLATAVEEVVCGRDWAAAFERCGLRGGWPTSRRFLTALGPLATRPTTTELPTLPQLQCLFPRGRCIPIDAAFASCLPVSRRAEPLAGRPETVAGPEEVHPETAAESPWFGRTRSTSRLPIPQAGQPVAAEGSSGSASVAKAAPRRPPLIPVGQRLFPAWQPPMPRSPSV